MEKIKWKNKKENERKKIKDKENKRESMKEELYIVVTAFSSAG